MSSRLALVYGDISGPQDIDFYRLPTAANDVGPVTLKLTSAGISLLMPRLSVWDEAGNLLAESESHNPLGDVVTLQFEPVARDATYFVRVSGAVPHTFGSYLLTATFGGPDVEPVTIDVLAGRGTFGLVSQRPAARCPQRRWQTTTQ